MAPLTASMVVLRGARVSLGLLAQARIPLPKLLGCLSCSPGPTHSVLLSPRPHIPVGCSPTGVTFSALILDFLISSSAVPSCGSYFTGHQASSDHTLAQCLPHPDTPVMPNTLPIEKPPEALFCYHLWIPGVGGSFRAPT